MFLHAVYNQRNQARLRERGLGFIPSGDYFNDGLYDPYYDNYDFYDYGYGYGGDYFANPPDWIDYGEFQTPWQFDPNAWSTDDLNWLTGNDAWTWGQSDTGEWVLQQTITDENSYSDLQSTIDWWNSIASEPFTSATDEELHAAATDIYNAGHTVGVPTPPPRGTNRQSMLDWIKREAKKMADAAKKVQGSAGTPSSTQRPATMPPNAQGNCAPGYQLNPQTKQCVRIAPVATSSGEQFFKDYGLYLLGGAILLTVLAKK